MSTRHKSKTNDNMKRMGTRLGVWWWHWGYLHSPLTFLIKIQKFYWELSGIITPFSFFSTTTADPTWQGVWTPSQARWLPLAQELGLNVWTQDLFWSQGPEGEASTPGWMMAHFEPHTPNHHFLRKKKRSSQLSFFWVNLCQKRGLQIVQRISFLRKCHEAWRQKYWKHQIKSRSSRVSQFRV